MPDAAGVAVVVHGLYRGADVAAQGHATVEDDALVVRVDGGRWRPSTLTLPFAAIDGLRVEAGTARAGESALTLFLGTGDVLELTGGTELRDFAARLASAACDLPEQTLRLRALGSGRANPGDDHDRFFAPLLAARRRAHAAVTPEERVAAFDARELRAGVEGTLAAFAAERFPERAADRRALEAELAELAEDLLTAIDAAGGAAAAVRASAADARFAAWRAWAATIAPVFAAADRLWIAALPALGDSRGPQGRFWRRVLRLGAVAALALPAGRASLAGQESGRQTIRVRAGTADSLRALRALGADVVAARGGAAYVVADSTERARLAAAGVRWEPVRTGPAAPGARRQQVPAAPVVYRPFDDPARGVAAHLDSLASANPRVHLDTLGLSVEGRPILAAKLGAADDAAGRANVLFMATYHAREWVATEVALRLLRLLAEPALADALPAGELPAGTRARIERLVAERDVWVVPVVNPDGYQYTFTADRLWRKNRRPGAFGQVVGVDLNRNHSERWGYDDGGSSGTPTSEVYRGPAPASEPETQAVERFHAEHPPIVSVSYHTFGGVVLYPPGFAAGLLPGDLGVFRAIAGTPARPAVLDRVPDSPRALYHPAPGWNLYPTNGEYTDFAYLRHGTIAFTPELTSGFEQQADGGVAYYGFEFADDEARVERVFLDNLPFALDALEAAGDPLNFRSPTTGLGGERLTLESAAPRLRVRVPAAAAPTADLRAGGAAVSFRQDTVAAGRYTRRLVSDSLVRRPSRVTVRAGALAASFELLVASGAEAGEGGWTANAFADSLTAAPAGARAWVSARHGTLRSPVVQVPAAVDTVSVLFWTRYRGDPFAPAPPLERDSTPHGELRVSRDGGLTWTVEGVVRGDAPVYYTEQVTVAGVAGRAVQVEFAAVELPWTLDEIALVAHRGAADVPPPAAALAVLPSENPVRGARVTFSLPSAAADGLDLRVYDFAGRVVWQTASFRPAGDRPDELRATWEVGRDVANGVYVVVARGGGRTARQKLFLTRDAQ